MGQPWDRLRNWWLTRARDADGEEGSAHGGVAAGAPGGGPDSQVDELVWQAQRELDAARAYFESVSDPDLVDHACYLLEAAQKRYSYLLRLARQGRIAG